MKFVRFCLIALAFIALPLALLLLADIQLVEREAPTLFGTAARSTAESAEARTELLEELGAMWLEENPALGDQLTAVGLDPARTMNTVFSELAESEAFLNELERGATQYGSDLVDSERPLLSLNFGAAIAESKAGWDPALAAIVVRFSKIETEPVTPADAIRIQRRAADLERTAMFVAGGAALLLGLLTMSVRHHFGSVFFVGMPALFLQRFILNEIASDPDPVDALIGSLIAETWLPWTHRMMFVSAAALVLLLASYKLFPPADFNSVPYAKGANTLPPRPAMPNLIEDDSSLFDTEDDHQSLRQFSIVED